MLNIIYFILYLDRFNFIIVGKSRDPVCITYFVKMSSYKDAGSLGKPKGKSKMKNCTACKNDT